MDSNIKGMLDKLKSVNVEELKREGKEFNFIDVYPTLIRIFDNINLLSSDEEYWELLPDNLKNDCSNLLRQLDTVIQRLKSFSPTSTSNPSNERNSIVNQIKEVYRGFHPIFVDIKINNLSKESAIKEFQTLQKEAKIRTADIDKLKQDALSLLESIKKTAGKAGISKYSDIFSKQAKKHRSLAIAWLVATIGSAIVITTYVWITFNQLVSSVKDNGDFSTSFQLFIAKVLLLSFFSYVFYQIAKNYNANMHLYIVNKHRENSLTTFESFVKATDDNRIKDAILLQATRCIFETGDTGYLSSREKSAKGIDMIKIFDHADNK